MTPDIFLIRKNKSYRFLRLGSPSLGYIYTPTTLDRHSSTHTQLTTERCTGQKPLGKAVPSGCRWGAGVWAVWVCWGWKTLLPLFRGRNHPLSHGTIPCWQHHMVQCLPFSFPVPKSLMRNLAIFDKSQNYKHVCPLIHQLYFWRFTLQIYPAPALLKYQKCHHQVRLWLAFQWGVWRPPEVFVGICHKWTTARPSDFTHFFFDTDCQDPDFWLPFPMWLLYSFSKTECHLCFDGC